MFGKRDERKPLAKIDTLIGAGTFVEGDIRFSGGLRIDGTVKGNVEAADGATASTLILSEQARIEGSVAVAYLVNNGTVVGQVSVAECLDRLSVFSHEKSARSVDFSKRNRRFLKAPKKGRFLASGPYRSVFRQQWVFHSLPHSRKHKNNPPVSLVT